MVKPALEGEEVGDRECLDVEGVGATRTSCAVEEAAAGVRVGDFVSGIEEVEEEGESGKPACSDERAEPEASFSLSISFRATLLDVDVCSSLSLCLRSSSISLAFRKPPGC